MQLWLQLLQFYINVFVMIITGVSEQERESISGILETVQAHIQLLESFHEDHSSKASSVRDKAEETFQHSYMVILPLSLI